jgi:hypothetical protein
MFMMQAIFGAMITCLAVYTFLNIDMYAKFPVQTQLYMIWALVALGLLIYGLLQLAQALVEMLNLASEKTQEVE